MRSLPLALFTALALAQIGLNLSDAHAAGRSMPRVGVIVLSIGNTPASAADNLTEILIAAVSQLDKYEIVGKEEFQSILGVQSEKRALTCLHDTTCLSKVGLELGITEVLVGNVSKRDGVWSLVLDRVDVRRSKVMRHLFYDTDKGEEELLSAVFGLADQLFAAVEEPPPKPEPRAEVKPTPPLEKPNDTLRHAAYGAVGLGVVFGAVAAIYGLRVRNTAAEVTGRCCIDGAGARQIYDMTREEAAEKLKAFKERLSSRRGPGEDKVKDGDGRDRTRGDAEKPDSDRADSDVEKIYAAVKAGKLTREEAGKKLRALKSKKASGGGKDKKESRDRGDGATTPTRDF